MNREWILSKASQDVSNRNMRLGIPFEQFLKRKYPIFRSLQYTEYRAICVCTFGLSSGPGWSKRVNGTK